MSSTQFLMVNPLYDMSGVFTDASTNIIYQANASRNFINLIGDVSNIDVSNTLYESKTYDPSLSLVQFVKKTKRNFLDSSVNTILDSLLYWARNTSIPTKFPIPESQVSGDASIEQSAELYDHTFIGLVGTEQRPSPGTWIVYGFRVMQGGVDIIEDSPAIKSIGDGGSTSDAKGNGSPSQNNNSWIGFIIYQKATVNSQGIGYCDSWSVDQKPNFYCETNQIVTGDELIVKISNHSSHIPIRGNVVSSNSLDGPWTIRGTWHVETPEDSGFYYDINLTQDTASPIPAANPY